MRLEEETEELKKNIMNNSLRIFTVGELLKDVIIKGMSKEAIHDLKGNFAKEIKAKAESYSVNNGGSPANLAAYTCLLGGEATLLTSVGKDEWGRQLETDLKENGVELCIPRYGTSSDVALIHQENSGTHRFIKLNWECLPQVTEEDVQIADIQKSDIVCASTVPCYFPKTRAAVYKAKYYARETGKPFCVDINLRSVVYNDNELLFKEARELIQRASVVKLTGQELGFMVKREFKTKKTPRTEEEIRKILEEIQKRFNIGTMVLTLGDWGTIASQGGVYATAPAYDFGEMKNTIGAGDAYIAAFLKRAYQTKWNKGSLEEVINYACNIAGRTVTDERTISSKVTMHLEGKPKYSTREEWKERLARALEREW